MSTAISAQNLLRDRGLRVTPQRQSVLNLFLTESGQHFSADQIRQRLLPQMPGLARGTTYKVLQEFVRAALCEELATPDGVSLYGLRLRPHHHFICDQCGRWFDVEVTGVDGLRPVALPPDSEVRDVAVFFHGVCSECRGASGSA
ncbi:MAG: Fur family transcriptional regulator [Sulfobacillus acidophilus]|uniref:Fur family transcriptional regulator n=1 Tax=Sulfobacillus acidophilus TaxID=53633 RepID=A0A2T2WFV7_9FIRM|nr:MAG: Fur family transcriptional regulator [Sulfobacillus acidophilus]